MSIVFAILLFSLLIFVHELGHFMAAKASKVQVNEFALFMGPAIFKKKVGETTYSLRCIPIGGFCAMEGEDADTDNPRSFQKAKWWKRFIILVAGAAMNFVIGALIMLAVFAPAKQLVTPVISSFEEFSTVNEAGGLQVGDKILELDGEKIYIQSDFSMILSLNEGDVHDLVVERDGKKVYLNDFLMHKHEIIDEEGQTRWLYGMNFTLVENPGFWEKAEYAWLNTVDTVRNVRLSLVMLLTGKAGLMDLGGPVMIVDTMSQVADATESVADTILNLLYFGGFISVNLAVMNLLPIPALDGGRVVGLLLTTAIEGITKKKLDPKYEGYIHAAGMILLLALMAFVFFKDIFVIFTR